MDITPYQHRVDCQVDATFHFADQIKNYTEKLNLTFKWADCIEIAEGISFSERIKGKKIDIRSYVWDYLDEFEGIAHCCDPEYWSNK